MVIYINTSLCGNELRKSVGTQTHTWTNIVRKLWYEGSNRLFGPPFVIRPKSQQDSKYVLLYTHYSVN